MLSLFDWQFPSDAQLIGKKISFWRFIVIHSDFFYKR